MSAKIQTKESAYSSLLNALTSICRHSFCNYFFCLVVTVFFICPQAAETKNKDLEGRIDGLQMEINDSRQKQGNMKGELKKFMDILDGKIDELHEFRQGLSKLGVDNWEKWHRAERVTGQVWRIYLQSWNYVAPTPQRWCPLRTINF